MFNKSNLRSTSAIDYAVMNLIKPNKIFIAVMLIVTLFNAFAFAIPNNRGNNPQETPVDVQNDLNNLESYDVDPLHVPIDKEEASRRNQYEKHYKKLDGTFEMASYSSPIHYLKDGVWEEIDNELIFNEIEHTYTNKANEFEVSFPDTLNQFSPITLSKDNQKISWYLDSSTESSKSNLVEQQLDDDVLDKISSQIMYENVLPGISLEYIIQSQTIKENIILSEKIEELDIKFRFKVENLTLTIQDNIYTFVNMNNELVYQLGDLFALDSNGDITYSVEMNVTTISSNEFILELDVDKQWLDHAEYPVKIDPTIEYINNISYTSPIQSITVSNDGMPTNYNNTYNRVSWSLMNNYFELESRTLVRFQVPSTIWDKVINYARLSFNVQDYESSVGSQTNLYYNVLDFDRNSVTWANKPQYDSEVIDYHTHAEKVPAVFDFTSHLKKYQNYGINTEWLSFTLKLDQINHTLWIDQLYSKVIYGYSDPIGLKDYWTYSSQDMGDLGTGYISDYTGNLTWVRQDFLVSNEVVNMPLSFYYNYAGIQSNIGYGYGVRTNYNMNLVKSGSVYYLVKPDFSTVYFQPLGEPTSMESKYIAEDGSRLILHEIKQNNTITELYITTPNDVKYHFDKTIKNLKKVENTVTGSLINITYKSGSNTRISVVSDQIGNKFELTYNQGGTEFLNKVSMKLLYGANLWNEVEYKTYTYNANYLTQVKSYYNYGSTNDPASTSANDNLNYMYSNGRLISAYRGNYDQSVTYAYTGNKVTAVSVKENNKNITDLTIDYTYGQTVYTDQYGQKITYQFDNYGHTINIFDSLYNTVSYRYSGLYTYFTAYSNNLDDEDEYAKRHQYYEIINLEKPNYYNNNQLIHQSVSSKEYNNPISNHGFEYGLDHWQFGSDANSDGEIQVTNQDTALGKKALQLKNSYGVVYAHQDISLTTGQYTLSGYIKQTKSGSNTHIKVEGATIISEDSYTTNVLTWKKYKVTFSVTGLTQITIKLNNGTPNSIAYFDNISLIDGFTDTKYNGVVNSSFEKNVGSEWETEGYVNKVSNNTSGTLKEILGSSALKIDGNGSKLSYAKQEIFVKYDLGTSLVISGWGKSTNAVPNKVYYNHQTLIPSEKIIQDGRFFGLKVEVFPINSTAKVEDFYISFDTQVKDWQYQSANLTIDPNKVQELAQPGNVEALSYFKVVVYLIYQGEGSAFFDNISVIQDNVSKNQKKYLYDNEGNMEAIIYSDGTKQSFTYENDKISQITTEYQDQEYITNITYQNSLIKSIEKNNVMQTFTYDNVTKKITSIRYGDVNSNWFKHATNYSTDGQYISSVIDEFGNTTSQSVNKMIGLVESIQYSNNGGVEFTYDDFGRLFYNVQLDGYTGATGFTVFEYDGQGRLQFINPEVNMNSGFFFEFEYNDLDQITNVKLGNQSIAKYEYTTKTGLNNQTYYTDLMKRQIFGTNEYYSFTYNDMNLIKTVSFNGSVRYEYEYDSNNRLSVLKDIYNSNIYFYSYDSDSKLLAVTDKDGNDIKYSYDLYGNIDGVNYVVNGNARAIQYHFNHQTGEYDHTSYEIDNITAVNKQYNYDNDSLRRLNNVELLFGALKYRQSYQYDTAISNYGNSSTRIDSITYSKIQDDITNQIFTITYNYDSNHNVIDYQMLEHVGNQTILAESHTYTYTGFDQIKSELYRINKNGQTMSKYRVYEYDLLGNITAIYEFDDISDYYYGNINRYWLYYYKQDRKDQINKIDYYIGNNYQTSYFFSYDGTGNIEGTFDGANGLEEIFWDGYNISHYFDWVDNISLEFKYNNQGNVTSKFGSKNGVTISTQYVYENGRIIAEKVNGQVILYVYDLNGQLISMNYNGNEYFYIANAHGDIIKIQDITGNIVVEYYYDTWGSLIYKSDTSGINLSSLNPFRYRGHYYDEDLEMYYINSRLYNPKLGRFYTINDFNYMDTLSNGGMNLYAFKPDNKAITTQINTQDPNNLLENNLVFPFQEDYKPAPEFINKIIQSGEVSSGSVKASYAIIFSKLNIESTENSISVLFAVYSVNGNFSVGELVNVNGNIDIGVFEFNGGIDTSGIKIGAEITAITAGGSVAVEILNINVEASAKVKILSVGGSINMTVEDGKIVFKISASALIGFEYNISLQLPERKSRAQ